MRSQKRKYLSFVDASTSATASSGNQYASPGFLERFQVVATSSVKPLKVSRTERNISTLFVQCEAGSRSRNEANVLNDGKVFSEDA